MLLSMATVRIWNPQPRKKKVVTREQVAKRQAKAVRFLRDVADDPALADEIEDLSVSEYAAHKGLLINPSKQMRKEKPTMTRDERDEQLAKKVVGEVLRQTRRSNPNGQQLATAAAGSGTGAMSEKTQTKSREKILDAIDDALTAWDDGFEDEARDILIDVLEESDES